MKRIFNGFLILHLKRALNKIKFKKEKNLYYYYFFFWHIKHIRKLVEMFETNKCIWIS